MCIDNKSFFNSLFCSFSNTLTSLEYSYYTVINYILKNNKKSIAINRRIESKGWYTSRYVSRFKNRERIAFHFNVSHFEGPPPVNGIQLSMESSMAGVWTSIVRPWRWLSYELELTVGTLGTSGNSQYVTSLWHRQMWSVWTAAQKSDDPFPRGGRVIRVSPALCQSFQRDTSQISRAKRNG